MRGARLLAHWRARALAHRIHLGVATLTAAAPLGTPAACPCAHRYAEALTPAQHGFYFLDSPGNDLESTAGQVAAGCNAVIFTTGNGAITNHPLVPTLKVSVILCTVTFFANLAHSLTRSP